MKRIWSCLLAGLLGLFPEMLAQNPTQSPPQKYKLSILEDASTVKRVKDGRVSSQVVVKVTDENDRPMPAIAVLFAIPQMNGGGAVFNSNGMLLSSVTTDPAGVASSGTFTAEPSSVFNMSVTASTPSGPITTTVPINMPAALAASGTAATAGAAGGASHTGLIVGILAGVGAVGAVAAKVLSGGKNNTPPQQQQTINGSIGSSSTPIFGPH